MQECKSVQQEHSESSVIANKMATNKNNIN